MDRLSRATLWGLGGAALLLALGFWLGWGWALGLWPVPGPYATGPLGRGFAASVLASIGASMLWIAATGEGRAVAGGGLDLGVLLGGPALAGLWLAASGDGRLLGPSLLALAGAAAALALAARWRRARWRDPRPLPPLVRGAFWGFVAILAAASALLLWGAADAFPWALSRAEQVVYGCVFLGAMLFFLYALAQDAWGAGAALLAGFLAYDLVLIGPLLGHLDAVEPAKRPALLVYLAAVSASGLLALWTLLLDPRTRVVAPAPPARA